MSRVVFLDAGPIGLVTNPKLSPESTLCTRWLQTLITSNIRVIIPEIADYEVRRELVRAKKVNSIKMLDQLIRNPLIKYLPITTSAMQLAAELWAQARNRGMTTAHPMSLDGDVILAAQVLSAGYSPADFVIATSNVTHLSQFAPSALWDSI